MELGVLGPFRVRVDGHDVALGGHRQGALLAILALRVNEVVSTDRLVDELWAESPPATALHTIQVFVSRLRSALGPAGERLITRSPGYLLELGADETDAARCEHLYDAARSALNVGDPDRAAALLRDARALWRGPPLAEFTYEPFAQATIARLEELRVSCREEAVEAELALGRHAEVVSELEALVREHPLRERPRGQLMLALYRCGRQADALEAYQQARRLMVDELGVEPSPVLRELEHRILDQDESLMLGSRPLPSDSPEPSPPAVLGTDSEDAASAPGGTEEPGPGVMRRRTATLLAVRMSTKRHADPEQARRIIAGAREEVQRIVARHGGIFVAGLGRDVVAIFGFPLTNEDDAVRALRAAQELHARPLSATGDMKDVTLSVGLDTGEVVAETPNDVFGDPLDRAIALAAMAADAGVLLSDATRRLAADAAVAESMSDGTTWRLLEMVTEPAALNDRFAAPMRGREAELALACGIFERTSRDGVAHMLTVLGEAGIGKSRFAQELIDRLGAGVTVLAGRCLAYGDGVTYWPLREAFARLAGGESGDAIRGLLGGQADVEILVETVASCLGLTPAEAPPEQLPWAMRRLLEIIASGGPVLLVIEDAHWAESGLLELIDYLIDWLTAPVMILCLARPELLDERPRWGGGHERVSSVVLLPLGEDDARLLLEQQLGDRQLSAGEIAQIITTAEGNPLFVQQLLAIRDEDPLRNVDHPLPDTVEALLAARLDRLGPAERAFIERAAVIGREFWPAAVIDMLPAEARPSGRGHLGSLVRRGLIHPEASILDGEDQLRFHHILIRDVAYRSTPKVLRGELHERFADWVARRGDSYDEFVGYHLEQAYRYRAEVESVNDELLALGARAADRLASAGRRTLSRGDLEAAVNLLGAARGVFDSVGHKRPEVLLALGRALSRSGKFLDADEVLQEALNEATETNSEATSARALVELSYSRIHVDPSASVEEMQSVAERAIEVFERLGDEAGLSRAWLHMALGHWIRSDCTAMEAALERALEHAERSGERGDRSQILSDLARTTVMGPLEVEQGIERCRFVLSRAEGDVAATAFAEAMRAVLEAMGARFDDARVRWTRSKARLAEMGLTVSVAVIQMYYGFIELLAGEPERAVPEVGEACATFERIGSRGHLSSAAGLAARLAYASGSYDECERFCQISRDAAHHDDLVSQVLWRSTYAKLLARGGGTAAAEEMIDGAVARADETDFLMLQGDARADRAEVLQLLDRPEEAATALEQAGQRYLRKGIRVAVAAPVAPRRP